MIKNEQVKLRILLPYIISILILFLVFLYTFYWGWNQIIKHIIESNMVSVTEIFNSKLHNDAEKLEGLLDLVLLDKKTQELWLKRDEKELRKYITPIHENILLKYKITHFYLIEKDRTCFMRVHKHPRPTGGIVKHKVLTQVINNNEFSYGIELGSIGLLALRVIKPWYVDGKLVGYIELAEEIEHITSLISKEINSDIFIEINKKFLTEEKYEKSKKITGITNNWNDFEDSVIIDKSTRKLPKEVISAIKKFKTTTDKTYITFFINKKKYALSLLPLIDVTNTQIGHIIVVKNISYKYTMLSQILKVLLISGIIIVSIVILFFNFYLNYVEKTLNKARFDLNNELKERKATEEKLKESNRIFDSISKTALDSIIMINSSGIITYWNKSAQHMFGYSKEEAEGNELHALIIPDSNKEKYKKGLETFKESGTGNVIGTSLEVIAKNKNQSEFFVEISVNSLRIQHEWHAVGIVRDITLRKQLEAKIIEERDNLEIKVNERTEELNKSIKDLQMLNLQLIDSRELQNRFLQNMSHELRTPLNAILGFSQALQKQYYGPLNEKQDEYANLIYTTGKHLLDLINTVLNLALISSGVTISDFNMVEINLKDTISEIYKLMLDQFSAKSIKLNLEMTPETCLVYADKLKLKQILINLLSNALKFTFVNGFVTINVSKIAEDEVKISIIDTGIGISKEDQQKIFEQFYQAEIADRKIIGGTGIGLTLTKTFVEMHKGKIGIESEEGKGSTFWFTLPLKQ